MANPHQNDNSKRQLKTVTANIPRWPEDDEELWWFTQALWGLRIPRTQVCDDHSTPFQAFAEAYFGRVPVSVWKASRGFGGKSRTLAALALTEAVALSAEVSLLGGSGAQSLNVHEATNEFWEWKHAPRHLIAKDRTKYDTYLTNGSHLRTLMASQTSVRGPHPQRLRLDEIDEMELTILEAAQGQPMRKYRNGIWIETNTVMSSTHQYPDKTMTMILKRARENGWPVHEWCYRECANPVDGWLSPQEIQRKRTEIPKHVWETEYDLQEPSFEGRAIDTASVERCFDRTIGVFDGKSPVEVAQAAPGSLYVTGIDWAKEQDSTIVATFLANELPWTCVSWQRLHRLPWPVMVRKAISQWRRYPGYLVHDQTGLGNVVQDIIKEDVTVREAQMVRGVIMGGGRERHDLLSDYIGAIEGNAIRYPRIEYAYNEHKYATVDDIYAPSRVGAHTPDSVVAGAMAWFARRKIIRPRITFNGGGLKESGWI